LILLDDVRASQARIPIIRIHRSFTMNNRLLLTLMLSLAPALAHAGMLDNLKEKAEKKAESSARAKGNQKVAAQVNKRLLKESRKNQCSFKSGTDQIENKQVCATKSKKLANEIVDVKKYLQSQGYGGFKFVVTGHTDSSGDPAKNKDLSQRRAEVMVRELVAKGVHKDDIEALGMGSERMLVKPDNTPAKKAKNRRYEVEVRF
jgi:OOP family OmpA-OmpF porin